MANNKKKIKFNKYNSKENYSRKIDTDVDNATFSVVKTEGCNANGNNANSGNVKDLYLYKTKLTDVYNSRKTGSDVKTTVTVGGIPADTPLSQLTNMSLGEVIDMMLFKTTYPTIKRNPNASITGYKQHWLVKGRPGTAANRYDEITEDNISVDKGEYQIDKNGTTVSAGVRSNGFSSMQVTSYYPTNRDIRDGAYINVKVFFQSGPTPKDSDGNPYTASGIPYTGGSKTLTVNIYPYYNWFATGVTVTSETQQPIDYTVIRSLTTMTDTHHMGFDDVTVMVDMGNGDIDNPQQIKVPGFIKNCKTYVNGQWYDYDFEGIYGSPVRQEDNTTGKMYSIYTMKDSMFNDGPIGGVRLKFTVSQTQ